MPFINGLGILLVGGLVLWVLAGQLNLLLGRARAVTARVAGTVVASNGRVTTSFDDGSRRYTWKSRRSAPVDPAEPVELLVDGLLWDEIVQMSQSGKVKWAR